MIYNRVSSRKLITRIQSLFNVEGTDWIAKVPLYVRDGMVDMNVAYSLESTSETGTVDDYLCKLPCNIKLLVGIKYNNEFLPRLGDKSLIYEDTDSISSNSDYHYELMENGYISTSFESGEITIYYKSSPLEYDSLLGLYFPLIPDNDKLDIALMWYILTQMLRFGYIIPQLSLTGAVSVNPYLQYMKHKIAAKNNILTMDNDERARFSRLINTLIVE